MSKIVDCVIYPIRLLLLSSKMQISPHKLNNLCITDKKLLLSVAVLTGRLKWVNYQEISNCCRPVLTYWLTDWRRHVRQFAATAFLCCGSCVQWVMKFFYMADVNSFLLMNLDNAYFSKHLTENSVWVAKSCITVCFTYSWKMVSFWTQIFHKVV